MSVNTFSLKFYGYAVSKLLGQPRRFFSEMPCENGWRRSVGFLLVSSVIFTGAFLMHTHAVHPVITGSIVWANALGMVVIASGLGFIAMVLMTDQRMPFLRFFSIYAFSSGITLLAAWLPYFIWVTEPWKWWLIGTGLRRHGGLQSKHILIILSFSILIMVAVFGWFLSILYPGQG